ncbi:MULTISPECIES: cell division initiation protein [unclassified Streptomyces]|uniref:cell division initiation protein n=1 Tax=unclassified Streptomyces TaxID=2593676 RepID=UPI00225278AE|nr:MULTISPECIES: cell division initiation protein [unclassified Streptomyces]WSP57776.1 cell division initiation protein [Streptomyces sp. NBC_01241]WSU21488.1 cell division initiation protein [Streptomyces sp. NBC_01108]MCX4789657.1 cell division initiation protein [Streptomyces sp. NBC_01221]MCX4794616.1 cell division initiation protein [Streptomyces sp. NBC_01242]WSJ35951.1 cell division initiation protein [Streptomyces sp. NBC_01321]
MDVQKKLDEIVEAVGSARSMPMSASCVVNRAELLAMLEEVREALPGSLAHAQELIGGREQMAEQARQEAERIIEAAHAERASLISGTEVAVQSRSEADRILGEARREAEEVRAEADEYVDSKLANFEVVLTKTIGSVDRGREKLLGRGQAFDEQGYEDPDFAEAPERSTDPATLQRRADEYVDTKLGAFEAVLAKTLEAVGRGRQKLHGRVATDELGVHMAAQDAAGNHVRVSDEDHWAGLAELATPEPQPVHQQLQPHFPAQDRPDYAETYAYQEQPQPQQDVYGYQQQPDPYAAYQQQGYDQSQAQAQIPVQGYDGWQQQPMQPQQALQPQGESALDETSLFDTSMIDLDQLRRYEQER